MNFRRPLNLLSTKNVKTIKGEKFGFITYIMYFAPHKQNSTGKSVCSHATKGCSNSCLFSAGFGGMYTDVENGRINKTDYFFIDRKGFMKQLIEEIAKYKAKHDKKEETICIRLNGTSDIAWEKLKVGGKSIMELFPTIQFYDYTKNHFRFNRPLPSNYHLTFSRSENNEAEVERLLANGNNVAIVFDKLPKTYKGYKVINGDISDLRFKDEKNVVVGLKYKNMTSKGADNKKAFDSGFALRIKDLVELAAAIAA